MLNIDILKDEIVERLKPLNPDKIILFGSYAYGNPTEDSDIDLFLLKDGLNKSNIRAFELQAMSRVRDMYDKYDITGIDILSAPTSEIEKKEDYFYKVDILQKGKVWYEQGIS